MPLLNSTLLNSLLCVGMGLCHYIDLCFHASSLPCLHTFWHAIPTSFWIIMFFIFLFIISPQVAAIVHSNYWQVAIASIYVSKSNVSEALHIAQFPLHTQHQLRYYLKTIVEREANFSGKLYSICLTSCEAWRY